MPVRAIHLPLPMLTILTTYLLIILTVYSHQVQVLVAARRRAAAHRRTGAAQVRACHAQHPCRSGSASCCGSLAATILHLLHRLPSLPQPYRLCAGGGSGTAQRHGGGGGGRERRAEVQARAWHARATGHPPRPVIHTALPRTRTCHARRDRLRSWRESIGEWPSATTPTYEEARVHARRDAGRSCCLRVLKHGGGVPFHIAPRFAVNAPRCECHTRNVDFSARV